MVKKTAEEKLQAAAEFVEAGADEIFEKYAAADDGPVYDSAKEPAPPQKAADALYEAAEQYVDRHQAAHGSISVNDPLVLEQDISGLIAEATQQADQSSQQAAALAEAARQEWNKVFFLIKALKPRMASDEALRSSKLGALLNKLP